MEDLLPEEFLALSVCTVLLWLLAIEGNDVEDCEMRRWVREEFGQRMQRVVFGERDFLAEES
jgi:hypothetical protein